MSDPQYWDIANYPAGLVNHSGNMMVGEPNGTLWAGENVELTPTLKTRPGYTQMSHATASGLPEGEIMAMRQVRFPTNETSYVVVQVAAPAGQVPLETGDQTPPWPSWSDDSPRVMHAAVYDPVRHRIWVYGGASDEEFTIKYGDLWYCDLTTDTWTEITDAVNHPSYSVYGHDMVYDPVNDRLVTFGGRHYVGETYHSEYSYVWVEYDITTNTFSTLEPTGEYSWGSQWYHRMIYRTATHSIIVMGGRDSEMFFEARNYAELDLATMGGVSIEPGSGPPLASVIPYVNFGAAYDTAADTLAIFRNYYGDGDLDYTDAFWRLDCAGQTWTQLTDLTPEAGQTVTHYPLSYCSDRYYLIGYDITSEIPEDPATMMLWAYVDDAWIAGEVTDLPEARDWFRPLIVETDLYLVLGKIDMGAGTVSPVEGNETIPDLCTYIPVEGGGGGGGEVDPATRHSYLYVSDDHLPTTTGVFEQIYDLGAGAGVCSFAVLNDRLVVTEGVTCPPLVTGLSLSADASDWLVPKGVLVQQAGTSSTGTEGNYYDVSPQVCDKDPDTVANIGNIRSTGAMYICCDMPLVEAFWIEMETVNSLSLEDDSRSYSNTVAFTSAAHLDRQDLKATIDHWVQDAGATGHFEDAGNTPLTLGTGNDCPDVEVGLEVTLPGGTRYIVDIVDDGEGSGEVTLSETTTGQAVTTIYGMTLSSNTLSVRSGFGEATSIWSLSAINDLSGSFGGGSIRIPLRASEISANAGHIQVTITSGDIADFQKVWWGTGLLVCSASHVSIVERSGTTANGTTTPTEITFNDGESGFTASTWSEDIESDIIAYAVDETKDYLLIIDVARLLTTLTTGTSATAAFLSQTSNAYIDANSKPYFKIGTPTVPVQSWNQQTVTGYATASNRYAVTDVSSKPAFPQSERLYVGTTTDVNQVGVISAEDFQGVSVTESVPTGTTLWHAVSFDDRESFSVFLNDAWRSIVQHDSGTTWQYKDGADAWQNASTNDMYTALREAFAIAENQMTGTQLEAITTEQWKATGGVEIHLTNYIDFAFGMAATATEFPTLTSYTVGTNDAGDTYIYGWNSGAWTSGDGWDDNTAPTGIPWSQTGTVEYLGAAPFEADYSVLNEVPGYWFKFVPSGTSSDCAISRILYKAPCQPLSNIGDGQPEAPNGVIFEDDSTGLITDHTSSCIDNVTSDLSNAAIGAMQTADHLYVGYYLAFNCVNLQSVHVANTNASVLSAEYWNGEAWTSIAITDGTAVSGKTLATIGKISWSLPTDWRTNIPFDSFFSRGYWIRFSVSSALSAGTALGEVRVYSVPATPKKHKFVETVSNRIALLSRPDAWDQADLSRALEEYGLSGATALCDEYGVRIGGLDQIQAVIEAWNGLLIAKPDTLYHISEASGYTSETLEAARLTPINSQVIIKGPASMGDDGSRAALYFLNPHGAFVLSGFGSDEAFGSGRNMDLSSGVVRWWLDDSLPRIAKNYLHKACGCLFAPKNWLVWSVPMITTAGQTEQTTNNRLIVFDMNYKAWLPPFTISLSAMCTAYSYSATAAGKIGPGVLLGGTYDGKVLQLFSETATTDGGTAITAWSETPWMQLNGPTTESLIRNHWAFGDIYGTLALEIYADGDAVTALASYSITSLDGSATVQEILEAFDHMNESGRWFKFKFTWLGVSRLDRFGIIAEPKRDDMPTG